MTARLHLALLAEATPDVSGFAQSPQARNGWLDVLLRMCDLGQVVM